LTDDLILPFQIEPASLGFDLREIAPRCAHSLRSHTGGLQSVFCEVHAPAKHGSDCFFAVRGEKLCKAE
jgi:hypothetical protein